MVKSQKMIVIDDDLWFEAKKRAIDLRIDLSDYVEKLIKEDVGV